MAKVVDITEKLSFDENPKLIIKGREVEVNTDASTVIRLLGTLKDKNELEAAVELFDLLFDEEGREVLEETGLSFKDLQVVIGTAMELALGESDDEGEPETRTMTS